MWIFQFSHQSEQLEMSRNDHPCMNEYTAAEERALPTR